MATQDQWAFLLQHEADRTWIHLDLPDMVVLAGRYRIIARSLRRNVDAEISIAHTSLPDANPPNQRRTKKRAAKTNDKGFLLVLPFTDMPPGLWEFRCAGDVMSELLGDSWQHTVQLNVQPQTPTPIAAIAPEAADWAPIGPATPIVPAAPVEVHPIATIDPVAAELEDIFTPIGSPIVPPTDSVVPDPILGDDALSLEDLFGDPATTVDLDPSQDLASSLAQDLAAIGQPTPEPEPDLEVDVWSAPDEQTTPAALTQLEVVSNNDETLLDWDATSLMRPAASAPPIAATGYDRAATDGDDDFSVFDELFSTTTAPASDLSELNALLGDDTESIEDDSPDVITFTDADAMAVTAETDHPIDLALEPDPVGAHPTPAPSLWGIGTRTGAHDVQGIVPESTAEAVPPIAATPITTPPTNITASPANVAALIDASDILPAAAETLTATETIAPALASGNGELPYLTIDLDPSFYNFRGGEVLMIYGQINAETLPVVIDQGELVVNLIDPQTATQVAEYRQTLDRQALPLTIAAPLSVPAGLNVQLLVGEVALWDDGVEELAQQTFTAMAAVADLMAVIDPNIVAEEFEKAPKVVPTGGDAPLPPVDFAFFNLIGDAPENAAELAPLKKRESMKDVELPGATPESFGTIAPIDELDDSIFSIDDIELENPLAPVSPESDLDPADPTALITSTSGQPLPDDWFDLAADDQPASPQPTDEVAVVESETIAEPEAIAEPPIEVPISNPDPAASEVVVDDLPEALPTPQTVATPGNPLLIPADQPIPEPTIEIVDDGELITGQSVRVRVKLPNILPKLYVKLWINDRQSRTLMDGPRWMVDFMPNGRDELETMTQLTVPFGSLEIQIAAIAVEAATKRESYRTAIDRTVIPPNLEDDLPELSFDEF
jgi:hypothetical protein